MTIYKDVRVEMKFGNLKKETFKKVDVLPHTVWCPICQEYCDAEDNGDDGIMPDCGCNMNEFIHEDECWTHDDHDTEMDKLRTELEIKIEELEGKLNVAMKRDE